MVYFVFCFTSKFPRISWCYFKFLIALVGFIQHGFLQEHEIVAYRNCEYNFDFDAGEESPTDGTAFIFGKNIMSNPKAARRHVSFESVIYIPLHQYLIYTVD